MPRKHTLLVGFALSALLILGACQVEDRPERIGTLGSDSQGASSESDLPAEEILYQVGDIISINDRVLVVLGWDQPPGGDLNPPDEGKQYLVVDLIIANQGSRSFNSSPVFQMSLKDPSGQKYNVSGKANAASGSNMPNGEVNPGEMVRGKVGFHVPEGASDFIFEYEANLIGLGEVSVELGSTPIAMDPPQDLDLGEGQITYQVGDLIEISDLVIQVLGVSYPAGTDIVRPKAGYQFVAVDVQLENQGSTPQEISSIVQMYLKDATGEKFTFHLGAQSIIDSGLPEDELQPGERIRGQIGFQVPSEVRGLTFVFDAEIFGFGKVFIELE